MKRLWIGLFCGGFMVLTAAAAHAASAYFAGACSSDSSGTHLNCVFDALRQEPSTGLGPSVCNNGSAPTSYFWDYEDGSPLDFGSFVGHSYPLPILSSAKGYPYGYYVRLVVYCPEGASVARERYICVYGFGIGGCITPSGSWY
jgi:hypothetical protein